MKYKIKYKALDEAYERVIDSDGIAALTHESVERLERVVVDFLKKHVGKGANVTIDDEVELIAISWYVAGTQYGYVIYHDQIEDEIIRIEKFYQDAAVDDWEYDHFDNVELEFFDNQNFEITENHKDVCRQDITDWFGGKNEI